MMHKLKQRLTLFLVFFTLPFILAACATNTTVVPQSKPKTNYTMSWLAKGKRYYQEGYYKKALHILLPLACDGDPEAQYAIGYMYYYGYGVTQDIDTGYFWIQRSGQQHFPPALKALAMIDCNVAPPLVEPQPGHVFIN